MKLSTLIQRLQEAAIKYEDLPVTYETDDFGGEITTIIHYTGPYITHLILTDRDYATKEETILYRED